LLFGAAAAALFRDRHTKKSTPPTRRTAAIAPPTDAPMITPVPSSPTPPADAATTLDVSPAVVVVVVGEAVVEPDVEAGTLVADVSLGPVVGMAVGVSLEGMSVEEDNGVDVPAGGVAVQNGLVHVEVMPLTDGPQEWRTFPTLLKELCRPRTPEEQNRTTSGTRSGAQTHQACAVRLFRVP